MVVFTVLYPATPGAKFDQAYYDDVHIPLVREAFTPTGLTDVQVLKGLPGPDGSPAPFGVIVNITFRDAAALQASLGGPRAAEVLGDVPKFTDIAPVSQVSVPG